MSSVVLEEFSQVIIGLGKICLVYSHSYGSAILNHWITPFLKGGDVLDVMNIKKVQ